MTTTIIKDMVTERYFTAKGLAKVFENIVKELREKPESFNEELDFKLIKIEIIDEGDV